MKILDPLALNLCQKGFIEFIIGKLESPGELTIEVPLDVVIIIPDINCKKNLFKSNFRIRCERSYS